MVDGATDSTAPEEGQATAPEDARGMSLDEATTRMMGLMGVPAESEAQEDEEPAPEEEGESAAPDDEAEGTPPADEDAEQKPTYKVKVDGEELDVPLDELLRGYSRTADYTRKTQAAAELRKTLEAEQEQVRAERSQYEQALSWVKSQLEAAKQDEPDWKALLNEDPIEYVKQKELWRDRKEQLAAVEAEQRKLAEQKQAEFRTALAARVKEETERLASLIPEWRDSKTATSEKARLMEYGQKLGFSEQELAQVYDHRAVLMLRKAMLYDDLQASGQKKLKEAPSTSPAAAKPGSPASRQTNRDLDSAKARLKETGRVSDAQAVLERMFASR